MTIQSRVCQHLRASGINAKTAARLASLTHKWVKDSGPEWTAQRWKSLATYAQQRLVEPQTPIPEGWKSRRNRSGRRILADGALHRYLEFGNNPSSTTLMQMQAICRIPTVIFNKRPTAKAIIKSLKSIIEKPQIEVPSIDSRIYSAYVERLVSFCDINEALLAKTKITPLRSTIPSNKTSPFYWKNPKTSHYEMSTGKRSDLRVVSPTLCKIDEELYSIMNRNPRYTSFVFTGSDDKWSISPDYHEMDFISDNHVDLAIGRLSLLNKDGCAKIRVIASPLWELQCALAPTKQVLMYLLYHERCSSVHDQDDGRNTIKTWLERGKQCYGFDQSAFTDRFPYTLQRDLLRHMYNRDYLVDMIEIELIDFTVKRKWVIPQLAGYELTYAVGQPMGLNPSFPLATLSHILVCFNLHKQLELNQPLSDMVRVVGDDIVISNDKLAEAYRRFMVEKCGVKINLEKSMISNRFTTFCGKIIGSDGVIPSTKIRPIRSASSLVEKLLHYGMKAIPFFSKEIKRYGKRVFTPYPFGYDVHPDTIPYKTWLNSHDLSKASPTVINDEIRNFVGSYSKLTPELIKRQLDWDEANPSRWNGLGQPAITDALREKTRESTIGRPPVTQQSSRRRDISLLDMRTPSFADRVDASARTTFNPVKKKKKDLLRRNDKLYTDHMQYTNALGYIHSNQVPSKTTGEPEVIETPNEQAQGMSMTIPENVIRETIIGLKETNDGPDPAEFFKELRGSRSQHVNRRKGNFIINRKFFTEERTQEDEETKAYFNWKL